MSSFLQEGNNKPISEAVAKESRKNVTAEDAMQKIEEHIEKRTPVADVVLFQWMKNVVSRLQVLEAANDKRKRS